MQSIWHVNTTNPNFSRTQIPGAKWNFRLINYTSHFRKQFQENLDEQNSAISSQAHFYTKTK